MIDLRISKENPIGLGFVFSCIFAQAITIEELNIWADSVIMATDEYPDYILDLSMFNDYLAKIYSVVGFAPYTDLSEEEETALYGIADLRGVNRFEPIPTKEEAAVALRNNPQVIERFCEQFTFIELNA